MSIHKPSLVLGASFTAACVVALSAVQATATVSTPAAQPAIAAAAKHVTIAGIPPASQWRTIVELTPLTVPAGGIFVVTGVGGNQAGALNVPVLIDGVQVLEVRLVDASSGRSFVAVPPGVVAPAGSTVSTNAGGVVHGYVARVGQQVDFIVDGIPTPEQMMRVVEGSPFVVPAGKRFAVTGIGTKHGEVTTQVRVDGAVKLHCRIDNVTSYVYPIAPGITVPAGSTVSVHGNTGEAVSVLLGFLEHE